MWSLYQPVKARFGVGEAMKIAEHMDAFDYKKGFLLADKFMMSCGKADQLKAAAEGRIVAMSDDVDPNPTLQNVDTVKAQVLACEADCIIALGGGSAIDCAKAVSAAVGEGLSGADFLKATTIEKTLPLIAIPTTAGTGSEVTRSSVLSDHVSGKKAVVFGDALIPRLALVDPEYTYTMPPAVTAATGLDVMAHALDSMFSMKTNHVTEALAMKACKLAVANLETAILHGDDCEARANMAQASTIAGLAFSQTGTAGSHACSYVLTAKYHVPHGEACAFTLDDWCVINAEARPSLKALYQEMGFVTPQALADWINKMKKIGGLRARLSEVGAGEDALAELAHEANINHNMANNAAKIGYDGILDLFRNKL